MIELVKNIARTKQDKRFLTGPADKSLLRHTKTATNFTQNVHKFVKVIASRLAFIDETLINY